MNHVCLSPGSLGKGGIGTAFINLAHGFIEKGIQVDLILSTTQKEERLDMLPPQVTVVEIGPRTLYALPQAISYLRSSKPDLVIAAHYHVNVLMMVARVLSGMKSHCRLACTFHTHRSLQLKHANWRGRLYDWLTFRLHKMSDAIVAVSKGVADDIENTTPVPHGAVHVIYNPAWSSSMEQKAMEPCCHPWLQPDDLPVIIGIGRLCEQKDFSTLLKAFSLVREKIPSRLIILGDGEDRRALEALIVKLGLTQFVDLPGHVSNPYAFLNRSQLFVLSSAWEGFGNVLVEALGCGLPVVSTDCPSGPREVLDDGKYGELAPVGNAEKLAEAMIKTISNPPSKKRQRAAAERFTFEQSVSRYLSLFTY